jgi:hypothetical protein
VSTDHIPEATRKHVAATAQYRCEYCQTAQKISGGQMHVEHVIPLSQGGDSQITNLALACAWCNSYKWTQTQAVDPESGQETPLFNPRSQQWYSHFRWDEAGLQLIGLTAVGRATVAALKMNNEYIMAARRHWVEAGWHPPEM